MPAERDGDFWLRRFRKELARRAHHISDSRFAESRRLRGQFGQHGESRGYSGVRFYVEKGLAGQKALIRRIVGTVADIQREGPDNYMMRCCCFEGGEIEAKRPITVRNESMVRAAIDSLRDLSGTKAPDAHCEIPDLGSPVPREELVVFVCRDGMSCTLSQKATARLRRAQRQVFWFYVGTETLGFETWKQRQNRLGDTGVLR